MNNYPKVILTEEGMRDGLQIERAGIPVADKIRLLDALSETGLKDIAVGSTNLLDAPYDIIFSYSIVSSYQYRSSSITKASRINSNYELVQDPTAYHFLNSILYTL